MFCREMKQVQDSFIFNKKMATLKIKDVLYRYRMHEKLRPHHRQPTISWITDKLGKPDTKVITKMLYFLSQKWVIDWQLPPRTKLRKQLAAKNKI